MEIEFNLKGLVDFLVFEYDDEKFIAGSTQDKDYNEKELINFIEIL